MQPDQVKQNPVRLTGTVNDYGFTVLIRTTAGPSITVQSVLSGGPYIVWSDPRHLRVRWSPGSRLVERLLCIHLAAAMTGGSSV
jgi:hypothetical protein